MSRILAVAWCLAVIAACVAGAAWTDHSAARATPTPEQRWLDEHLVWAEQSPELQWTPLADGPVVRECGRSVAAMCADRRPDSPWPTLWGPGGPPNPTNNPALKVSPSGHSACPPVIGDGRLYVAADPVFSGCRVFTYDLRQEIQIAEEFIEGISWRRPVRRPVWLSNDSLLPDNPATGMAYAGGRLFVGGTPGWVDALHGQSGALVWRAPSDPVVGAPVPATYPTGERVIIVNCRRGETGSVLALDEGTGRARWGAWTSLEPIASPFVAGSRVLVAGVGPNYHPRVAAFDLATGAPAWTFEANRSAALANKAWDPNRGDPLLRGVVSDELERRPPGGLLAVPTPDSKGPAPAASHDAGGSVYFACGDRLYAIDLRTGQSRWEHAPAFDRKAVNAAIAIRAGKPAKAGGRWDGGRWGELPWAPWVTAPVVYGDAVIFGTPDGLRAVGAADGKPLWHVPEHLVGAVDQAPVVTDGILYATGQGWIGGPAELGNPPVTCAIRLAGPHAAPVITAARTPLRHWPWAAAAIVLVSAACAAAGTRTPAPRFGRPDLAAIGCVVLAAAVAGAWVLLQLRRVAPAGMPQPGVAQPIYEGPAPFAFFAPAAALAFVALLIATRRGRKFAFAAGLSAILGAAVVAVWARSRHSTDLFQDKTFELRADRALVSERGFQSAAGGFQLRFVRDERSLDMGMMEARSQPVGWYRWSGPIYPSAGPIEPSYQSGTIHSWRGFEAQSRTMSYGWTQATSRTWSVTFPAWSLVAALAVLPAAWLARPGLRWLRRRRGAKRGLCPACGYDLRASPGQCPECGAMGAMTRKPVAATSSQK